MAVDANRVATEATLRACLAAITGIPTIGTVDPDRVATEVTAQAILAALKASSGGGVDVVSFVILGGGAAILNGIQRDVYIPYSGTITAVTLLSDQVGSIALDLFKVPYGSFPPSPANSICAASFPTISNSNHSQDLVLTGWTKAVTAGDIIRPNVRSCIAIQQLSAFLTITK